MVNGPAGPLQLGTCVRTFVYSAELVICVTHWPWQVVALTFKVLSVFLGQGGCGAVTKECQ